VADRCRWLVQAEDQSSDSLEIMLVCQLQPMVQQVHYAQEAITTVEAGLAYFDTLVTCFDRVASDCGVALETSSCARYEVLALARTGPRNVVRPQETRP